MALRDTFTLLSSCPITSAKSFISEKSKPAHTEIPVRLPVFYIGKGSSQSFSLAHFTHVTKRTVMLGGIVTERKTFATATEHHGNRTQGHGHVWTDKTVAVCTERLCCHSEGLEFSNHYRSFVKKVRDFQTQMTLKTWKEKKMKNSTRLKANQPNKKKQRCFIPA